MKRNRLLGLALSGVLASGAVGWVAGTRIQSSNEAEASAGPPDASSVTAAVKRQGLSATIVTRGTAQYGEPQKVSLAPGSGGGGLVTRPPEAGATLNEGDYFMEANGKPVFALQGDRPMYRELGPGDSGEDVRQLETALSRLGFDPGTIDGVYDGATANAVDRWYEAAGYRAEGPTDAERSELRASSNAVDQSQTALAAARRQLAEGTKPPTAIELLQAENEARQAADGVIAARLGAETKNRAAEREVTARYDALNKAKEQAVTDAEVARRTVEDKYAAAELARASLSAARSAPAEAGGGRVGVLQAEQAVKRADQELADARAARDRQPDESTKTIAAAEIALSDARSALPLTRQDGETAIRNAETNAALATLRLQSLKAPKTNDSLAAAVKDAEASLARAQKTLSETESATGIKVAAESVVFFPRLPLRIDSVKVKRGDAANGEVMTVSGANLEVDASLTIADAKLVSKGMEVQIEAPDLSIAIKGRITEVAEKPGTDGVDNQHVHITIEPIDPPANFRDAAVKITIPVKSTAGEVLVVPVSAVSSGADGSARVEVDEQGVQREVPVRTGLSAGGLVEVTALSGELDEGDQVVVGTR